MRKFGLLEAPLAVLVSLNILNFYLGLIRPLLNRFVAVKSISDAVRNIAFNRNSMTDINLVRE
jgi:hypothetical protein